MLNGLLSWIYGKLQRAYHTSAANKPERAGRDSILAVRPASKGIMDHDDSITNLRFELMVADGGIILKLMGKYDQKNDRHNNKLFIIHENEDVAKEVGRIIASEIMRL